MDVHDFFRSRFRYAILTALNLRVVCLLATLVAMPGVAQAEPAPQLGPSVATMWPYTQTTGPNLLGSDLFGTVSSGCNLAGWRFLNQKDTAWSAVPDPIGGVESGNCVAQLGNAASSTIAQTASRPLTLPPGFYATSCNVATKDNNAPQLSIEYLPAGYGRTPTSVKLMFEKSPNDTSGHSSSSLRTVVSGGSPSDSLCINLINPLPTGIPGLASPNNCHTPAWAPTIGTLAKAINANPHYHASVIGNFTNALATNLDPAQSGTEILNRAVSVSGGNQFGGYGCGVAGLNTSFRTDLVFGNTSGWMKPMPHWKLGEVPRGAGYLKYLLMVYGRPSGTANWGMGKGTGLFRLADPAANIMVRFPNYLHTYVDTLADNADLKVDYRSVTGAACSGTPDCSSGECEVELLRGDAIVAHRCVTLRATWQTATGFGLSLRPDGNYEVRLAGIESIEPSAKISKIANIPVAWNGFFDSNNWFHKRIPGSFSHANTGKDVEDFSGPLLALGFYDTQAAHLDLAGNQCVLNGVAGNPIGIASISETGTTVTVATTAPHGLSSDGKAAIAQLHSPLAAAAYDNSNFGPITVTDSTHFTFTAKASALPSDTNDGVVGGYCAGGQGFIGDIARNARLDLYLNYFLGITDPAAIVQLGNALQGEPGGGILRIDAVNAAYYPWKGYDPELTGKVLSADKENTGCYCTCQATARPGCKGPTEAGNNSKWNVAGYCGPNNLTLGRPSYYLGNMCAAYLFDDLNHRLGGGGNNPPGLGSASIGKRTEDPSFFGMYVHDEPTMEFLSKAQNLVQYIRTYSRSTPTFGAFIFGFAQTANQLSAWRDVNDVPMIDNYPIASSVPIGGTSPTTFPALAPGAKPFPATEGVQQSVWKLLLSVNGDPTTTPITPGTRPIALVEQDWGASNMDKWPTFAQAENMAWLAIFSGANSLMFWTAGVRGEAYIRSCPDYGDNALACEAQHKATVVIPLFQELVEYNSFTVSTNKRAIPGLPAGVLGYESSAMGPAHEASKVETRVFTANATASTVCDNESPKRCWAAAGQQGSTRLDEVPWF